jgi:methyl-accepting chemotaxis protein
MTIRKKIILGFVAIFVCGLLLGAAGMFSTVQMSNISSRQNSLQQGSSEIASVLTAHYAWRQTLTEAVLNTAEFTGSLDSTSCALGKWLNGESMQAIEDAELINLSDQVREPHEYIHRQAAVIVDAIDGGNANAAIVELDTNILPATAEVIDLLTQMSERYQTLLAEASEQAVNTALRFEVLMGILIALSCVVSVLLAVSVIHSVMVPLRMITKAAETIADGDLDVNVEYKINDQIGRLASAFDRLIHNTKKQVAIAESIAGGDFAINVEIRSENDAMNIAMGRMVADMNQTFGQVAASTLQIENAARMVSSGAQNVAQGATEQTETVSRLSELVSEVSDHTAGNTILAEQAQQLAQLIKSSADKGGEQMMQMTQAVQEINAASQSISNVIKTIDDIAFQTNILALNAAVEAARAGQHGKGFAVVAEEVRSLATKSADAAKNTGELIVSAQQKAVKGEGIADSTAASLAEILDNINQSAAIVERIADGLQRQSLEIEEIRSGIKRVVTVVHQNSATAEESAAASEELSSQAQIQAQIMSSLRLQQDMLDSAQPSYNLRT